MAKTKSSIPMPDSFAKLIFATQSHLGGTKIANSMKPYVFAQRKDGITVFDIDQAWDKYILAARAIVGLNCYDSICAVSGRIFGRKPVLKFAEAINCRPITSRFIPGSFTNTTVRGSIEPRLIIVSDPIFDKQSVNEASMVNCPVIAFCNTDASLCNVDIAIPANNRSPKAIGVSFFILSRLVNYIRHGTPLDENIKNVELFFYRDQVELDKLVEEHSEVDNSIKFAMNNAPTDTTDYGRSEVEVSGGEW